jgi:hypothetical protein
MKKDILKEKTLDFAQKEIGETIYWLELLFRTKLFD